MYIHLFIYILNSLYYIYFLNIYMHMFVFIYIHNTYTQYKLIYYENNFFILDVINRDYWFDSTSINTDCFLDLFVIKKYWKTKQKLVCLFLLFV